ncbi:uncharacterized protein C19C7.04c [Aspergillus udagawae]|uniref:Uncharacterized protein C19C7.04c n=1 Tax=Aspergillus udagawae TaxID=91492 RepID=A0A8E0QWU4_9EURO|nr:uncharacterized protein Aud_008944 [Aspergillus udagawae]GFF31111.1 uncharacterized protein C19C7.04c [Aspergillus udagawae]GFF34173.1 uncharacterized protein C19C7.04c [Aspergillus udagawae]GFF88577.1 uncharacterized protein C19C7.04c [Aspergillus udagawae]GIC92478.1 hypothetical protein Aud_008944 [Aspergillus udagawae]
MPFSRSSRSSSERDRAGSIGSRESYKKATLSSKADPNQALTEAQPINQAVSGTPMFSLRSMQHRDKDGNIISDPDRSNPTRPRLERPLDTIRSFEAAIEARRREM